MTKLKVLQLGVFLGIIGFFSYKFAPFFGLNEIRTSSISNLILITIVLVWVFSYEFAPYFGLSDITTSSISNLILITIVLIWVSSYLLRVVKGNMTFMEQRKRYRKLYDKKFAEKLEKNFESLSNDEQKKLLEKLDEK